VIRVTAVVEVERDDLDRPGHGEWAAPGQPREPVVGEQVELVDARRRLPGKTNGQWPDAFGADKTLRSHERNTGRSLMIQQKEPDPDWYVGGGSGGGASRKSKHIIIGIDGTWQAAYSDIFQSNVHRLCVALNFEDETAENKPQMFIYSAGVGTANRSSRIIAGTFGEGLDELILGAYINLVSNYIPGDKIYVFGFSRGAIAARALTGLISYSGLLKADSSALIEHAWRYFVDVEPTINFPAYRAEAAWPPDWVDIEFLGIWDAVPGPYKREELLRKYRFENLLLDRSVKRGVHVVSIDETRRAFQPLLWEGCTLGSQDLEQIWMPGVHSDIGGGYGSAFLSTISLLLMIDRFSHYCPELSFDTKYIEKTLLPIIEREEIVINDEWKDYSGLVKWFSRAYPRLATKDSHTHHQHPLTRLMTNHEIMIRSKRRAYAPSFVLDDKILPEVRFSPSSWYDRKLQAMLKDRFKSRYKNI
jgi:hypothetical protein